MLKSSSIFTRNGAHLVEKNKFGKNKDCPLSKFECFEHAKTFLICVKLEHVNFVNNEKHFQKKWQSKLLCFIYDLSKNKNVVKKVSIHLGGSFNCVFTQW